MEKPFKTIDEQIAILKSRNLNFINEIAAKKNLSQYGYYEIINSYKDNYLVDRNDDTAGYLPTATFENIFSLLKTDRKISQALLGVLEDFETILKQSVAYAVSEKIGYLQNDYINPIVYKVGDVHKRRNGNVWTDRDLLMHNLRLAISRDTMPFKHYRESVGNVPPWIAVKSLSLGNSIYWFRLLPDVVRIKVIASMYGISEDMIAATNCKLRITQSFGDTLNLALEYRNLCAHGGRVYNHRNKRKQLAYTKFIYEQPSTLNSVLTLNTSHAGYQRGELNSSVGGLMLALTRLDNTELLKTLNTWIGIAVQNHLKKFPNDETYLMDSLELKDTCLG